MTDFDTTNLASGYFTASVTIGATASRMGDLVADAASVNSGMVSLEATRKAIRCRPAISKWVNTPLGPAAHSR